MRSRASVTVLVLTTITAYLVQSPQLAGQTQAALPAVSSVSPNVLLLGEDATQVRVTGKNLSRTTGVEFSNSAGVSVTRFNPGQRFDDFLTFRITVSDNAAPGDRTLRIVGPSGVSNDITVTIRKGNPRIKSISPASAAQGRAIGGHGGPFVILGEDLYPSKSIDFNPPDDISFDLGYATDSNRGKRWGMVALGQNARPGTRSVSITTASGKTNVVSFEVLAAPRNAPIIKNVQLSDPTLSGQTMTVNGELTVSVPLGSLHKAKIRIQVMGLIGVSLDYAVTGPRGTEGKIVFSATQEKGPSVFTFEGNLTAWVSLIDDAGNESNAVPIKITRWYL